MKRQIVIGFLVSIFFFGNALAQQKQETFYLWRDFRKALIGQQFNFAPSQAKVLKVNYSLLKGASGVTEKERIVIMAKEFGLPQSVINTMLWFYEINQNIQKIKETKLILCQDEHWLIYLMEADEKFKYDYGKTFLSLTVEFK